MPKKTKHGGRRSGSGRPPLKNGHTVRKTATIPAAIAEYVEKVGGGNYSEGVRFLVEFHKQKAV